VGKTRKPRKAYRPHRVDTDPMDLATARAGLLMPTQKATLVRPVTAALDHLRRCVDPWTAWCSLADALNVAEQLALRNIASDRQPEFHAAQQVMHDVYHRQATRGTWAMRAPELAALDFAVQLHVIQLGLCTQGELADSIQAVQRRVAQALAGNAPKDAQVCVGQLGNKNPETNTHNTPRALEAA
jgi:hypothetical protein